MRIFCFLVFVGLFSLPFASGCKSSKAEGNHNEVLDSQNTEKSEKIKSRQENVPLDKLYHKFAVNDKIFWAVIVGGQIAKSYDGGATWQRLPDVKEMEVYKTLKYYGFYFFALDENHAWISGNGKTWETEDGAETWKKRFNREISGVFFYDTDNGWMSLKNVEEFENYRTQDSGKTWQPCEQSNKKLRVTGPAFFISPQIGWSFLLSDSKQIIEIGKTVDGGCNWERVWKASTNPDTGYADIFFINENIGWFSTLTNPGLYETKDGGRSWHKLLIPNEKAEIETFFFKNEKEGWLLFASLPERPLFYRTFDGGRSWSFSLKEDFLQSYATEVQFPRVSEGLRTAIVVQSLSANK